MKENYQLLLDNIIKENEKNDYAPTLLLHSCCGPCSSYCLEYLSNYFRITIFYYNPNIYPKEEYFFRVEEQRKLIEKINGKYPIDMVVGKYDVDRFYKTVKGMEKMKEGSVRCHNSQILNEIGQRVADEVGVKHLPSDFKKKNGYKRSVELSLMFGMYRQDYCGCIFSKMEREEFKKLKESS